MKHISNGNINNFEIASERINFLIRINTSDPIILASMDDIALSYGLPSIFNSSIGGSKSIIRDTGVVCHQSKLYFDYLEKYKLRYNYTNELSEINMSKYLKWFDNCAEASNFVLDKKYNKSLIEQILKEVMSSKKINEKSVSDISHKIVNSINVNSNYALEGNIVNLIDRQSTENMKLDKSYQLFTMSKNVIEQNQQMNTTTSTNDELISRQRTEKIELDNADQLFTMSKNVIEEKQKIKKNRSINEKISSKSKKLLDLMLDNDDILDLNDEFELLKSAILTKYSKVNSAKKEDVVEDKLHDPTDYISNLPSELQLAIIDFKKGGTMLNRYIKPIIPFEIAINPATKQQVKLGNMSIAALNAYLPYVLDPNFDDLTRGDLTGIPVELTKYLNNGVNLISIIAEKLKMKKSSIVLVHGNNKSTYKSLGNIDNQLNISNIYFDSFLNIKNPYNPYLDEKIFLNHNKVI